MNVNEIIKGVAKVYHTTPEEVYSEMQIALDAAFNSNTRKSKKNGRRLCTKELNAVQILFFQGGVVYCRLNYCI